jgi:hypothetical protein
VCCYPLYVCSSIEKSHKRKENSISLKSNCSTWYWLSALSYSLEQRNCYQIRHMTFLIANGAKKQLSIDNGFFGSRSNRRTSVSTGIFWSCSCRRTWAGVVAIFSRNSLTLSLSATCHAILACFCCGYLSHSFIFAICHISPQCLLHIHLFGPALNLFMGKKLLVRHFVQYHSFSERDSIPANNYWRFYMLAG